MTHAAPPRRADYARFQRIETRWMDNDVYGHVNNVVYYAYFDTIINRVLIEDAGFDPRTSEVIGLCVESGCSYLSPASYPEPLDLGLRIAKLGRSSVRYEVGVFRVGHDTPCAHGHFVHVFVDRVTSRPVALPDALRAALEAVR